MPLLLFSVSGHCFFPSLSLSCFLSLFIHKQESQKKKDETHFGILLFFECSPSSFDGQSFLYNISLKNASPKTHPRLVSHRSRERERERDRKPQLKSRANN